MRIARKRIRKPDAYLLGIQDNESFYIASVPIDVHTQQRVLNSGFTNPISIGDVVLPSDRGSVSRFNANGGHKVRRDLPKEKASRDIDVKDWHGNWHSVTITYERYPRDPIPAPGIELTIAENLQGQLIVQSPRLVNSANNSAAIKHVINLFLELYGECEVLQSNLLPAINVPITRLNWDLLPPGDYPWNVLQPTIQTVITTTPGNKRIIQRRFEYLASFTPNFVAVGRAGFRGYFVFGYPNHDFFVLESIYEGHATYVLGQDWAQISQLSKAEILNNQLHLHRFVHNLAWEGDIRRIL